MKDHPLSYYQVLSMETEWKKQIMKYIQQMQIANRGNPGFLVVFQLVNFIFHVLASGSF